MNASFRATLISVGLAAAAMATAYAQPENSAGAAPQGHHQARHHHGKRPFSLPSERIEARLAYVKTALKISDAQQPQWDAYAEFQRKQAHEMDQRIQAWKSRGAKSSEHRRLTAIDRIERRQQHLADALHRSNELLEVEKPLYAALTPEQKGIADEVLASHRHGMFRRGGMHRNA